MTDSTQQLLEKAQAAAEAARHLAEQAQQYSEELAHTAVAAGVEGTTAAEASGSWWANAFGFIAVILASVNIFGGFLVTERMLAMYKKKG